MNEIPRKQGRKERIVVIREKRGTLGLAVGIFLVLLGCVRLVWAFRVGARWAEIKSVIEFLSAGGDALGWLAAGVIPIALLCLSNYFAAALGPR